MTILGLEPLPSEAAGQLLDELLATDLPTAIREVVVSRAEGNPFFVEELVGSLIDAGGSSERTEAGGRVSFLRATRFRTPSRGCSLRGSTYSTKPRRPPSKRRR